MLFICRKMTVLIKLLYKLKPVVIDFSDTKTTVREILPLHLRNEWTHLQGGAHHHCNINF